MNPLQSCIFNRKLCEKQNDTFCFAGKGRERSKRSIVGGKKKLPPPNGVYKQRSKSAVGAFLRQYFFPSFFLLILRHFFFLLPLERILGERNCRK